MHHRKKIGIVDDHPVFRKGLAQLINEETDLKVTMEAESVAQAMDLISRALGAPGSDPDTGLDLVIVDLTLKDRSGIDLIQFIHDHYPLLPVLVISMHSDVLYVQRVLKAGALGYITKQEMTGNVVAAIRQVIAGKRYVSADMMDGLLEIMSAGANALADNPLETLSNRELEVFELMGHGYKRQEIAQRLNLSVKTIGTYLESIKKKLNLKTTNELMTRAVTFVGQT